MSNRPNTRTRSRSTSAARAARLGESGPARRPWWPIGIGVLVVGLAALVALAASMGNADSEPRAIPGGTIPGGIEPVPSSDATFGEVQLGGVALAPFSNATPADPAVGQAAPQVAGMGLDGEPIVIPAPGRPTLIAFLAHWCPHCQNEVPELVDWFVEEGLPSEVEMVAVATANDRRATNHPAGVWLHREAWPVPTLLDDEDSRAGVAYGVSGYPFFVAVDASGMVVARSSGAIGVSGVQQLIAAASAG